MAETAPSSSAVAEERSAPSNGTSTASSILGECVLRLTHATTYEPPLYLFPELLPQVPQGTPPLPVWDAVADAVDIAASSWRVADAAQLLSSTAPTTSLSGDDKRGSGASAASPRPPPAMVTLASMVGESRLLAAGIDASVLKNGSFSASSVIEELSRLQTRMGLTDEEGAAIMSNHFINLLAWRKLREINGGGGTEVSGDGQQQQEKGGAVASASSSSSSPAPATAAAGSSSRKRARALEDGNESDSALLPSPTPWTSGAELARGAGAAGHFVAASETNVEDRVELLRTLAALYARPWRTLASQGQQTDYVVPPGTVNATSPYADSGKLPGAVIDPVEDMGWAAAPETSAFFGRLRVAHTAAYYSVLISSRNAANTTPACRVPLKQLVTYVGREAGLQRGAAVAAAALVSIDVGLATFTAHADVLSKFHCALVLRPTYGHTTAASSIGAGGVHTEVKDEVEQGEGNMDESEIGGTNGTRDFAVVHTKTPDHYTLWLVNYGRNGVRIAGKGWVLGEPRQLASGDCLVLGGELELRIEVHTTAAAACAAPAEAVGSQPVSTPTPSQVKRERAEEEE